jgi:hypothetical protein
VGNRRKAFNMGCSLTVKAIGSNGCHPPIFAALVLGRSDCRLLLLAANW